MRDFDMGVQLQYANHFSERNWTVQLHQELDATRKQLAYQKHLHYMCIVRETETRTELEKYIET